MSEPWLTSRRLFLLEKEIELEPGLVSIPETKALIEEALVINKVVENKFKKPIEAKGPWTSLELNHLHCTEDVLPGNFTIAMAELRNQ